MAEPARETNDILLGPTEFVMVLDGTKGSVSVVVGPFKSSLGGTDYPAVFDDSKGNFVRHNNLSTAT